MPKGVPLSVEGLKLRFAELNPKFELVSSVRQGAKVRGAIQYKIRCLDCAHIMERAGVFCTSYSCDNCSKGHTCKITHEKFISRMEELYPTLKCLSKFKGTASEVKVKCIDCGHTFSKNSQRFMYPPRTNNKTGCPNCYRWPLRKTTKQVKEELTKARNDVQLIGEYLGVTREHTFRSLVCGHKFTSTVDRVLNQGYHKQGCNACTAKYVGSLNIKGSQREFLQALKAEFPHIKCMGEFKGLSVPIKFVCTEDGFEFDKAPNALLGSTYGCLECARRETGYKYTNVRACGKTFKVQGYEPHFIRYLAKKDKASVKELQCGKDVPRFTYRDKSPNTGKMTSRSYRPDFYVPSKNLIIEVKSTYTAAGQKAWLTTLQRKRKAVLDAGYRFLLVIFDDEGNRLKLADNWHSRSLSKASIATPRDA